MRRQAAVSVLELLPAACSENARHAWCRPLLEYPIRRGRGCGSPRRDDRYSLWPTSDLLRMRLRSNRPSSECRQACNRSSVSTPRLFEGFGLRREWLQAGEMLRLRGPEQLTRPDAPISALWGLSSMRPFRIVLPVFYTRHPEPAAVQVLQIDHDI